MEGNPPLLRSTSYQPYSQNYHDRYALNLNCLRPTVENYICENVQRCRSAKPPLSLISSMSNGLCPRSPRRRHSTLAISHRVPFTRQQASQISGLNSKTCFKFFPFFMQTCLGRGLWSIDMEIILHLVHLLVPWLLALLLLLHLQQYCFSPGHDQSPQEYLLVVVSLFWTTTLISSISSTAVFPSLLCASAICPYCCYIHPVLAVAPHIQSVFARTVFRMPDRVTLISTHFISLSQAQLAMSSFNASSSVSSGDGDDMDITQKMKTRAT